ncbi:MAG: lipid-A-disaccharide synthase [Spirochaetia bacterium]|nr:lipid-A-disaccharide synthase [Spirochaetia bacterium]
MKKILISAGEASADFYGAELAKKIMSMAHARAQFIGFGGPRMREAGIDMKIDLAKHAVMGFVEAAKKAGDIKAVMSEAVSVLKQEKPDVLVVIDYPGFHLWLIKKAKELGIKKVVYYMVPQVWVWKYGRIKKIKKYCDLCIVGLPFEEKIFKKEGINTRYFGHPVAPYMKAGGKKSGPPVVGIFPGSRENEIKKFLPDILKACALIKLKKPSVKFRLFRASTVTAASVRGMLADYPGLHIGMVDGWNLKQRSSLTAAIAKSGTGTLELALLHIPHVIVYRLNGLSYMIIRTIASAKAKFAGLPNILAGREIVRELLQNDFSPENTAKEILLILGAKKYRRQMLENFDMISRSRIRAKDTLKKIALAVMKEAGI